MSDTIIMKTCRLPLLLFLVTILFMGLTSCSPPQPIPSVIPLKTVTKSLPTATLVASTAIPPTIFPSKPVSPTPSPTLTMTPYPAFKNARALPVALLSGFRMMVTIEASENFKGQFFARVDHKELTCDISTSNPNWLHCYGPLPKVAEWVELKVYPSGGTEPVFESKIYIPSTS